MSERDVKNIVASVLAKLRNHAKSTRAPFQQVLQQYAMERFLYRISKSKHAETVVLKGALLLKTIGVPAARPTIDIDMLRRGKADQTTLMGLVQDWGERRFASATFHFADGINKAVDPLDLTVDLVAHAVLQHHGHVSIVVGALAFQSGGCGKRHGAGDCKSLTIVAK